jgi:hypothetical protein
MRRQAKSLADRDADLRSRFESLDIDPVGHDADFPGREPFLLDQVPAMFAGDCDECVGQRR